ncbi:MAG: hypothetical protein M3349_09670 [Actinomycetota bacterium]|nr:hypothetical protein [Actinomycetota bacterium]
MSTVVLGSVSGAPGVSTLAAALTAVWPERDTAAVLVEADPDGGRLAAELGVSAEPGLVAAALAARAPDCTSADLITETAAQIDGWLLMPGPPSPEQAWSVLSRSATVLARLFSAAPGTGWILDCGRLSSRSPAMPFAMSADMVVMVSAGTFGALQLLPSRVSVLATAGCTVGVAVSGSTSWPAEEIAGFVGCDVVAMLPTVRVRRAARSMAGGEWAAWWSTVRDLAAYLHAMSARVGVPT